jgi:hypothetical protein
MLFRYFLQSAIPRLNRLSAEKLNSRSADRNSGCPQLGNTNVLYVLLDFMLPFRKFFFIFYVWTRYWKKIVGKSFACGSKIY